MESMLAFEAVFDFVGITGGFGSRVNLASLLETIDVTWLSTDVRPAWEVDVGLGGASNMSSAGMLWRHNGVA
jgi:hypothetical protein